MSVRVEITFKSGAQVAVQADDFKITRAGGDLRTAEYSTVDGDHILYMNLDNVDMIVGRDNTDAEDAK